MNKFLVDTHCHVYSEYYDDIQDIYNTCIDNNINYLISSGVSDSSNSELLKLSSEYQNFYITLGIHPEDASKEYDLNFIKANCQNQKVVAIGEIGLDYHYPEFDKEAQKKLFENQLKIAQDNNLPVVVHSREATKDTIDILKKYHVKGVIHSFSGSYETAQIYLKMGFKLGVNGVITFKNANIKDVIAKVGIQNILLETDSPYLTPEPLRGKKNHPINTKYVAEFISEYLGIDLDTVKNVTSANALEIFDKIQA